MPSTKGIDSDASERFYRGLFEGLAAYAVFAVAGSGEITTWNSGAERIFGYRADDIVGRPLATLLAGDELVRAHDERRFHRRDGSWFWGAIDAWPLCDAAGQTIGRAYIVMDATEARRRREALEASEERARLLIENVPDCAIFSIDAEGTILSWNAAARSHLGYRDDEILGQSFARLFTADDVANDVPRIVLQKARALGSVDEERWFVRKDGSRFLGSEKIGRLEGASLGHRDGFVHVAQDITRRHAETEEIRRRASLDALTDLPNRAMFFEHVYRAIACMRRRASNFFAVLFIDIDHFKEVNDTFGHVVADRVLKVTARRLERCARADDVVARIGGDEFAVLLNGIGGVGAAKDAADRIAAEIQAPIPIEAQIVRPTASVGIALGSTRYKRPEDILRDADIAMYRAKAAGRSRTMIYAAGSSSEPGTGSDDLEQALERREFRVAYQPIVRLADRTVVGFEALVRWQHPRRGLLLPGAFLVGAEQGDAIGAIDAWVLRTASRQVATWRTRYGCSELALNVNVSSAALADADFTADIDNVLVCTGLPARALNLEVTEGTLMERSACPARAVEEIRALGISLQIDHFGVGSSSLLALAHAPVAALKIDRSFVAALGSPPADAPVRAIVQLALSLGLGTVAVGVETASQHARLVALGCERGQGFFYGPALDAEPAGRMLAQPVALRS